MNAQEKKEMNPWSWVGSLYFAEGIPYVLAMTVSVIMYKKMKISNEEIAYYTSLLYLPWVIKPIWSPLIDIYFTKRFWIVSMEFFISVLFFAVSIAMPTSLYFRLTLLLFWIMAFSSATHDIACDGFYMMGMDKSKQSFFIGIRSTFYRLAMLTGQGLLVMLAGYLEKHIIGTKENPDIPGSWVATFFFTGTVFFSLAIYHAIVLPKPAEDKSSDSGKDIKKLFEEFQETFVTFFKKDGIVPMILFLCFYRFAESQLVKLTSPFLLDTRASGGLNLSTEQVGFAYGTVGVVGLCLGGILGGIAISKAGLKKMIWLMAIAINIPDFVYVYMSYTQTGNYPLICSLVGVETFGYGFGFTAYMVYMIYVAEGPYKTSHFAIATGFMSLGMMVPGMYSGKIQSLLGYKNFFIYVMLATIPSFLTLFFIPLDPEYGKKTNAADNQNPEASFQDE